MTTSVQDNRPPAVALEKLERHYGELTAVAGIDLEIADGEFFSLIGPSGCGKTTTLRIVAGLETPSSGKVSVRGQDVTNVPAFKRPVNTVFQHYALFPHLNVYDNVAFGLRERHVSRGEIKTKVADILELVGLTGREQARPKQLSGGQQQRVALARSLVLEPAVLLLDEPLGALDLKLRKQMQMVLKQIQREVGITFVYVTHDQEEAFSMSDRVAIMNRGKIEQIGDPVETYRRPRTLFVADFVGASNRFWHGSWSGSETARIAPRWARWERSRFPAWTGSPSATRPWPSCAPKRFAQRLTSATPCSTGRSPTSRSWDPKRSMWSMRVGLAPPPCCPRPMTTTCCEAARRSGSGSRPGSAWLVAPDAVAKDTVTAVEAT